MLRLLHKNFKYNLDAFLFQIKETGPLHALRNRCVHVFSIDARVANFEFNFGAFLYQTKETGPLRVKSNKETGPLALRIVRAFSIKLGLAIVAKN